MPPPLPPSRSDRVSSVSAGREERLAQLLAQLSDQVRLGVTPDLEGVTSRHPELGKELRELWAAAQLAEAFVRPNDPVTVAGRTPGTDPPVSESPLAPLSTPLPRTFGDFELLEELGRGGMGIVYKARDTRLQRTVALKMILAGEHAHANDLARFEREARAAAQLDHPNIVPVYDFGAHEGHAYFSMRLVEGQTLSTLLSRGPLPPFDAARYLATISRAVHDAHRQGILHRDLKPSNILLDHQNQPHITDFGLAKHVRPPTPETGTGKFEALTHSGALVGTPTYMAPEQVSNSRGTLSSATDVYSLGVILYECLTGRPPFQSASPVDTLLLVLDQDPVRPRLLNPNVDPDLELICLKCLQKEPDLRYASAAALAEDLEAFLVGGPLSVRSSGLANWIGLVNHRVFRETHHAVVLENWGVLWMLHSLKILILCVLTAGMAWGGVTHPAWYLVLWASSLVVWGGVFWNLRKRAGPVLFIERQVAHVWAGAIVATLSVFLVEILLGLPVLTLAPLLAAIAGMVFVVKAGMLSGEFYGWAFLQFLLVIPMSLLNRPEYGILLFGAGTAVCFFFPGLKYHLQFLRNRARAEQEESGVTR
jgi:serine/threonine protein kinase